MQIYGFECFCSLGLKMGLAPKIPGVGKRSLSRRCPLPKTPKPPPCKTWLGSFPPPWLVPSGAREWQGLSPEHGVWAQLEDQSVQMEQLRQELDARRDELEQAQRSLSHAKQVQGWGGSMSPGPIKPCHRVMDLPPLLSHPPVCLLGCQQ